MGNLDPKLFGRSNMERTLVRISTLERDLKSFRATVSVSGGGTGPPGPTGPAGPAGLTWQGAWNSATAYAVNDAVSYSGGSYRRIVAGTTATDPATDTTNWAVLAAPGATGATGSTGAIGPAGLTWQGAWNGATAYVVNDAVSYSGGSYRRLIAGTTATNPAADTTNWAVLASPGATGATGPAGPGNKVFATITGDGTTTSFSFTHNFSTNGVANPKEHITQGRLGSDDHVVDPGIVLGVNTDTITFDVAPAVGVTFKLVAVG